MTFPLRQPHSILIVEDERIVALDLKQMLTGIGYGVCGTASSADQAIAHASERRPDLVLMDIRLKGEPDGIETAQVLKTTFGIPAVYLTASADDSTLDRASKTEPVGYLTKPVRAADLRCAVEVGLYRHAMEKDRQRLAEVESQNRELQETTRLKNQFLGNMSHELRTPLNAVIGFADILHSGMAGPISETQHELLGHIVVGGRKCLQMVGDILDLADIEAGKVAFHPTDVNLGAIVEGITDALHPLVDSQRLRLTIEIKPSCARLVSDVGTLKQIIHAYLANAIKFTPEGGSVMMRVASDRSAMFRIEVSDTGIGIRPEDLERLFMPFEQLDSSLRKKFGGAGLGLALVKRLAEAQGGHVGVESVVGQGSTFFAVLPRVLRVQAAVP